MDRGMSRLRTCLLALAASAGFALAAAPPALAVAHATKTEVSCPGAVLGAEVTCTAHVKDIEALPTTPTGAVHFASTQGTPTPTECTLAGTGSEASCHVQFVPSAVPTAELEAKYAGDSEHAESHEKPAVPVAKRSVEVTMHCGAIPVLPSESRKCSVTVKDTSAGTTSTPEGKVTLTAAGPGKFTTAECTLAEVAKGEAACSPEPELKSPSGKGGAEAAVAGEEVSAAYAGDASHAAGAATLRSTTTTVSCVPAAPVLEEPSECTAVVKETGVGHPTGTVSFQELEHTSYKPKQCTLKPGAAGESHCTTEFKDSQGGATSVPAEYEGDAERSRSFMEDRFQVPERLTSVTVSCGGGVVAVGLPATCEVTVKDTSLGHQSAPEGEIHFSTSGGAGQFGDKCELKAISGQESRCTATYTPTEVGSGKHEVTAEFPQSSKHQPSHGGATVMVAGRSSSVSVACGSAVTVSQPATCTVTVRDTTLTGTPSAPAGEPELKSDSPGTFSAATCKLAAVTSAESACAVTYTPSQVGSGTHTITAKYPGDVGHLAESGSTTLSVSAPGPTTTTTTTTNTGPPPPPPGAPKCRLSVKEQWRPVGSKRHPREMPVLLVPYTCNQNATVKVEGVITIAASRHGTKKVKAGTVKLLPGTSAAHAESPAPAVVLALPATVANAIVAGAKTIAAVTFVVRNANGAGAATLKLTLVAQAHKRKKH